MKHNRFQAVLFAAYCALMLWLLLARPGYTEGIPYGQQLKLNLLPFETILRYIRLLGHEDPILARHAMINLAGNVVLFIPLGYYLPALREKSRRLWKTLLLTAALITLVELTQLVTLVGSCDVDDLILNLLGAAMGYGLYRLFGTNT